MKKKGRKWSSRRRWRKKYRAYLKSPEWKEKRRQRLEICKGYCERCKVAPAEHVHHLTYARVFNEDIEDLQAVCIPCHQKEHPGKRFFKPKPKSQA